DRFKATADSLQAKQNAISGFLSRQAEANSAMGGVRTAPAERQPLVYGGAPQDSAAAEGLVAPMATGEDAGSSALQVMPDLPAPQPRPGKPARKAEAGFLDGPVEKLGAFFAPAKSVFQSRPASRQVSAAHADHPALKALTEQTARVAQIGASE